MMSARLTTITHFITSLYGFIDRSLWSRLRPPGEDPPLTYLLKNTTPLSVWVSPAAVTTIM